MTMGARRGRFDVLQTSVGKIQPDVKVNIKYSFKPSAYIYSFSAMVKVVFVVDVCPSLTAPTNGRLSTNLATFGTDVTATCDEGFLFANGDQTKTTTCEEEGNWNPNIPTRCIGKTKILRLVFETPPII